MRIVVVFVILIGAGCGRHQPHTEEGKSLEELEKAISVIQERRESEYKIISQEEYGISVLTENIGKSNSEGMKNKIREQIRLKRAVIYKAEKNIANQDLILRELIVKRDSIASENAARIE